MNRRRQSKRTSAWLTEFLVSFIVTGLVAIAFLHLGPHDTTRQQLILNCLISVAGTGLALPITACALLFGMKDHPFVRNLVLTGHYAVIVRLAIQVCVLLSATGLTSLVGAFCDGDALRVLVAFALGFALAGALTGIFASWRFFRVISYT